MLKHLYQKIIIFPSSTNNDEEEEDDFYLINLAWWHYLCKVVKKNMDGTTNVQKIKFYDNIKQVHDEKSHKDIIFHMSMLLQTTV